MSIEITEPILVMKPVKFRWHKIGENVGERIIKSITRGYEAKVYKAYDNQLWSAVGNFMGKRGFICEDEAREYAESCILSIIKRDFLTAKRVACVEYVLPDQAATIAQLQKVNLVAQQCVADKNKVIAQLQLDNARLRGQGYHEVDTYYQLGYKWNGVQHHTTYGEALMFSSYGIC